MHEDKVRGCSAGLRVIPFYCKSLSKSRYIATGDNEVEISVLSRLFPEKRVDSPTTVDPDLNPALIQRSENRYDDLRFHRLPSQGSAPQNSSYGTVHPRAATGVLSPRLIATRSSSSITANINRADCWG